MQKAYTIQGGAFTHHKVKSVCHPPTLLCTFRAQQQTLFLFLFLVEALILEKPSPLLKNRQTRKQMKGDSTPCLSYRYLSNIHSDKMKECLLFLEKLGCFFSLFSLRVKQLLKMERFCRHDSSTFLCEDSNQIISYFYPSASLAKKRCNVYLILTRFRRDAMYI